MIDKGTSLKCVSHTLYPGGRLSRLWLDLERLHLCWCSCSACAGVVAVLVLVSLQYLRFTQPIASYGFRSNAALVLV